MAQKQFFIDGGFNTNADSVLVGNLDMTGHIIPSVDSDGTTGFDLGSPCKKWRDLYLSQGSLYIDGQKVIESDAGTIVVTADPDQSLTTKVTGTGVLTLQSETTVTMASTLQMGTGKKITDQSGTAVTFGDKIDMDSNKLINLGAPTDDQDATTKLYVDSLVSNIATDAITEGDTEIEIADLGTGTVGFTVDGIQRLALSAGSAAFTVPVTVSGQTLANEAYVDTAEADANTYADSAVATATTALQSYADTAEADAKAYADIQIAALQSGGISVTGGSLALASGVDLELDTGSEAKFGASVIVGDDPDASGNPAVCASSFRPTAALTDLNLRAGTGGVISLDGGDVEYSGVGIIGDDPDNAGNPTVCASTFRPVSGVTDLNLRPGSGGAITFGGSVLEGVDTPVSGTDAANKTYADNAEADAVATAAADATTKADAAEAAAIAAAATDATTKANAAQAAAEATAAADATTKANAAEAAAIAAVTNGAGAAFDTLKEIQDAMATDSELSTAISNVTASAAATAAADATAKADQALADAKAYADANDANTTYTAGNGLSLSGTTFLMSGSYTGTFTATGDICAYSDASLKTNVQTIEGAMGKVDAIRGVTFDRLADGSTSTGVIAQELEAVLPEAVQTDENGVKMVAYGNVTGLLIEALKELKAEVESLKK